MTHEVRCPKCNRLLLKIVNGMAVVEVKCARCHLMVQWPTLASEVVPSVEQTELIRTSSTPA